MSDIYGKCLNSNCRSSCQRFVRKIVQSGEATTPVKCRNCDCFQYQHDWLAIWEQGKNEHIFIKNISSSNNSSSSASSSSAPCLPLPSNVTAASNNNNSRYQTPSAGAVNKELINEVYPTTTAAPSTYRNSGGNSLSKQKEKKQQELNSSSIKKKQKLGPKATLKMFFLPASQTCAPTLSFPRRVLQNAGQYFEEFEYQYANGEFISQIQFEDVIRKSRLKAQFIDADWKYTFYQQHKDKQMVVAESISSEDFPGEEMFNALADDCTNRGMVVICKPGGPPLRKAVVESTLQHSSSSSDGLLFNNINT